VTGPDELAGAPGVTVPPELEVTLPPENGGGLDLFVRDDTHSMQEDAATINGNVLTNDTQGLTVTGIEIDGVAYGVGTNIDIPDVGTVNIGADGAYTFTPVLDYSGNVPAITYTVSNGTDTDTANLNIEVLAVADQPTTGNFELDPPALELNIQTWSNVKKVNGHNLIENNGDGANKGTLLDAINYLRQNDHVFNEDGSAVGSSAASTTTSLISNDLPERNAVYISGYVFLEAGQTYSYSGKGDDSAAIVIGDEVSSLHVNWRGTSTSGNGDFSVTQSGFYSFQFYAHNAVGAGNYNFAVQNKDPSKGNLKFYPNVDAIEDSLKDTSYVLGDYDAGTDGKNDTGFYPVKMGYQGTSADSIDLTGIHLKVTDTDGSEYLSFVMSGLPAGAVLTFKDALGNEHSVTVGSDGTASYIPEDKDSGTTEYTDFILTVGDKTDAVLNVTLTVMSTEKSNGDTSTSILDFEVKVTDAEASTPPTYAEDSVTGGFTNGLGEWDNADNNPWKYSENNELINYDTYLKKEAYGVRQDNAGIVEITTREPIAENALANGAKIAMQLAWNNGFSTESGQGESTVFKLIVGGVVYATVTTPSNSDSTPLDKTGQAVIVYGNGATGNVDYFDAPSYEKDGGDPSSKDFEWNNWEVYIPGVSGTPSISLQWDVQKSDVVGDPTSDDLYVKDLGVYPATTESLQLTSMLSDDNSIIFDLLNDDATGGNELQTIDGFTLGEVNDVIDISALLSADANESNWSDFITVDYNAENNQAVISIDRDGSAEQYHSENLVVLLNQPNAFDLDDLVQNNQIIIG
ncbi:type I secretion C-terminal target domain-containing protein, partial [Acinetobacter bohemicus]|uniref:Ig-like domain-containing protein n=2 Tax=Acinetobacter TaxID=469 RepID=UPI0021D4399E